MKQTVQLTKVAMIGCGKLGLDCAEVMAQHYDVVGYDVVPCQPQNFEMKKTLKEAAPDGEREEPVRQDPDLAVRMRQRPRAPRRRLHRGGR